MNKKLKNEILRKLFHLYQLPVIFGYILLRYYFSERIATFSIVILLMLILEFEFLRLDLKVNIPDPLGIMRRQEKRTATGMLFFVLAIIVVFAVFDFKIALTAILMTTFGDLASALMGIKYGKHKLKSGKSLEGFAAGFLTNLLVGAIFLWEFPMIVIGMAFVASIVELVTYKLDDNLTVPVFAGFTGHTIAYIMGVNLVQLTNPIRDFYIFLSNFF